MLENISFRAIVLATLFIVATLFATKQDVSGKPTEEYRPHPNHHAHRIEANKTVFGVGAEGWTAIFTAALFVSTTALFIVTVGLFKAAVKGSKDAERLFVADQRPWIKAILRPRDECVFIKDGSLILTFDIEVTSLGKTVAEDVAVGNLHYSQAVNDDVQKAFEKERNIIKAVMPFGGKLMFPGDTLADERKITINKQYLDNTWATDPAKLVAPVVFIPIAYRSRITGEVHEASLFGSLRFGKDGTLLTFPHPRTEQEMLSLGVTPRFFYFSLQSKIT